MKIVDRWEDLVHTHFVTDAVRLPTERLREIERAFIPELRRSGIVVGIHFARSREDPGVRIVLECQPGRESTARLETQLARIVAPIPARPPTVSQVRTVGS
ncbi:MAG TPA: hypothetical protein VHC69_15860 [Polyangiaceae bacterium]|nr:hypothetical protein [Polyangiaceae bacterium]